jgi:hypothetical protein
MSNTNHDTNMTGNADNCDTLRTKSGQPVAGTVHTSIAFRSRDEAITALFLQVFGASPVFPDPIPMKPDFPEPDFEPLSKRVDRVRLLELEVTDLERQLAEVTKQRDEWFELYTQTLKKLGDAREQIAKLITDV